MIKDIDELTYRVKTIVGNLTDEELYGLYPLNDGKMWRTTDARLLHLLAHFNYHLGQINYHRRLLDQPVSLPDDVQELDQPINSPGTKLRMASEKGRLLQQIDPLKFFSASSFRTSDRVHLR